MRVRLGGYNVDTRTIEELSRGFGQEVTPEVLSASYARISRDPRDVTVLREEARREVDRARRSNRAIVFGLGHSSVAEHAVFNFDIMDVSRLAVEAVEHFRLASFTEKSQRYIRLGKDFVRPREITESGFGKDFERLVSRLSDAYLELFEAIRSTGADEGTAQEDARYLMPLATAAQFGMTVNARELEYVIGKLAAHPLEELREISKRLSKASRKVAPSLVRYPEPTRHTVAATSVRRRMASLCDRTAPTEQSPVALLEATPDADTRLAASLIFGAGAACYDDALEMAKRLGRRERARLITRSLEQMEPWDGVWREFENIVFIFEVVVSASCYAQLKRHRMTTQIVQRYDPRLGISIPQTVRDAGSVGRMREAASSAQKLYRSMRRDAGPAAEYALTNAHRRRVLLQIDLRELYHFSRLRSDAHAQWEIRRVSELMCAQARRVSPAGSALLGGKDEFPLLLHRLERA